MTPYKIVLFACLDTKTDVLLQYLVHHPKVEQIHVVGCIERFATHHKVYLYPFDPVSDKMYFYWLEILHTVEPHIVFHSGLWDYPLLDKENHKEWECMGSFHLGNACIAYKKPTRVVCFSHYFVYDLPKLPVSTLKVDSPLYTGKTHYRKVRKEAEKIWAGVQKSVHHCQVWRLAPLLHVGSHDPFVKSYYDATRPQATGVLWQFTQVETFLGQIETILESTQKTNLKNHEKTHEKMDLETSKIDKHWSICHVASGELLNPQQFQPLSLVQTLWQKLDTKTIQNYSIVLEI
jgi:hypothetical protein